MPAHPHLQPLSVVSSSNAYVGEKVWTVNTSILITLSSDSNQECTGLFVNESGEKEITFSLI